MRRLDPHVAATAGALALLEAIERSLREELPSQGELVGRDDPYLLALVGLMRTLRTVRAHAADAVVAESMSRGASTTLPSGRWLR